MRYPCIYCNKYYASYQSRCNHIRRYHKKLGNEKSKESNIHVKSGQDNICHNIIIEDNRNKCSICEKEFQTRQGRWYHEKKCKVNKAKEDENKAKEDENKKFNEMKKEIESEIEKKIESKYKKEIEKLKEMFQQQLKIHPKTLNKINNQLNNSGTINNITIVQLGRENLSEHITEKEKRNILNRQAMGINDLVDLVHVSGKYKKFINVYITNMQNTIAYRYDEKMNNFIAVNKNELLNDLIDARIYDIEMFFEEIGPSLDPLKAEKIKSFIERINDEKDELKSIKKDEIKLLLYNNLDKIKQSCKNPDIIKIDNDEIEL